MRFTMYIYIWHGIDDTVIQDILYTYMNTYITYIYIYILYQFEICSVILNLFLLTY